MGLNLTRLQNRSTVLSYAQFTHHSCERHREHRPAAAIPAHPPEPLNPGGGGGGTRGWISYAGRGACECRRCAPRGRLLHPLSDWDRAVGVSVVTARTLR